MKWSWTLFELAALTTWLIFGLPAGKKTAYRPDVSAIVGCAPVNGNQLLPAANGKYVPLLPGWGHHHYAISTSSDSAQLYFDQGLTLYYSYHPKEAAASFREAARFDSSCAMLYWGEALAKGPPYNYGHLYSMDPAVFTVLDNMQKHAGHATGKEKALIQAMLARYDSTDPSDKQRPAHNQAYAGAMEKATAAYPGDADIQSLYIDAVMLVHPWNFWQPDGNPQPWTNDLVARTESILALNPAHPAALHYHIHLTEASKHPEVAFHSAAALRYGFPGVAHMVHMSSHAYERTGNYTDGIAANTEADSSLILYSGLTQNLVSSIHVPHYDAVAAYCALSANRYSTALEKARECRDHVSPSRDNTYQQYLYMLPYLVHARSGKWEELLNDHQPIDSSWTYARLLHQFTTGMAYARTQKTDQATTALQQLRQLQKDPVLTNKFTPYMSSPAEVARIAEYLLQGTIEKESGNNKAALAAYEKAVTYEDQLLYTEPKIWVIPSRQFLGDLQLQTGQIKAAAITFRQDLVKNPNNGWSALGMFMVQQQRNGGASPWKAKYEKAFAANKPPRPVY